MRLIIIYYVVISTIMLKADIISQSENLSICKGEEISLFVRASGTITNYEWYKDGEVLGVNNSGLIIGKSEFSDAGLYHCEIEESNGNILISNPILVDINQETKIISIKRNIIFEDDEQVWTFYANVHDVDLDENTFRWEFDSSIGNIEEVPGYSGINTNFLVVRFKPEENNFDYVRKLRFIADGDCGVDTAFTEVENFNLEIINYNSDLTFCENETTKLNYSVDYNMPEELIGSELEVNLMLNDEVYEKRKLAIESLNNSKSISFDIGVNENSIGDYKLVSRAANLGVESEQTNISYYPDIKITDRSNEPFSIFVGQPIKLRILAEGSIAEYVWIKEPNDTLKVGDDPFWEVLASKPSDEGAYRCIMKSKCGDTTLFFTVKFKENSIEQDNYLSVVEIPQKYNILESKFYSVSGREVDPRNLKKGLYFVKQNGKVEKLIIK